MSCKCDVCEKVKKARNREKYKKLSKDDLLRLVIILQNEMFDIAENTYEKFVLRPKWFQELLNRKKK